MPSLRRAATPLIVSISVSVSGLLGLAACSPPSSAASAPGIQDTAQVVPVHSSLRWHPCPSEGSGVKCAMLSVPANYADPSGRHLELALDMVPATAPRARQQGILLVNPGGPGGSGLPLAPQLAQGLDPSVAAEYDIVGFDPRGVGASVPALSCDASFYRGVRPDYVPASRAAERVLVARARGYAEGCERRFGWLLPYLTTQNVARDLDAIRASFGVAKLNYFSFSYGTYIGQVYATLFPHRVRRMVLDSTVDPTGVWWADNIDQDYAFQGRMEAFFAWTAANDATYHLGGTAAKVRSAWYEARRRVADKPAAGRVGPAEFDDTFLLGGYLDALWPGQASALAAYLNRGQASALVSEYQQNGVQDENEFAVYNAVQCADVNWPRNWARWDSEARHVDKTAPFQAWDNTWYNASCAFWAVKGPARPMRIGARGLPGILMIQGTLDPATPYAGAQNAHRQLPSARMVVVKGGGNHGQSLAEPPDACVQNYLNAYLATGALPAGRGLVNAECPANPAPGAS